MSAPKAGIAQGLCAAITTPSKWLRGCRLFKAPIQQQHNRTPTTVSVAAPCLPKTCFSITEKCAFPDKATAQELQACFLSQQDVSIGTGETTAKVSAVFQADLTRASYTVNGRLVSQPGMTEADALKNLHAAFIVDGKFDAQGLYAVSKFVNQAVLAGPTLLLLKQMEGHFPAGFHARAGNQEIRYQVTRLADGGYAMMATHTKQLSKVADDLDRDTWIQLGKNCYSTCYAKIHLDRASIDNIDVLLCADEGAMFEKSSVGYALNIATPSLYLDALAAMDSESQWNLFSDYLRTAEQAAAQPQACFIADGSAAVNQQLRPRIEAPQAITGAVANPAPQRFLAKDIYVFLLGYLIDQRYLDLHQRIPEFARADQPLTVELVQKVSRYVLAQVQAKPKATAQAATDWRRHMRRMDANHRTSAEYRHHDYRGA